MPVHTQESSLKVLAMIFEARYDEGFRFLDRAGELLVRIRQQNPSWAVAVIAQKAVSLARQQDRLTLNIGVEKLDVSTTERLGLAEAEKQAGALGEAAEEFYNLTLDVLKVPRTLRIGTRFVFLAPADNLEEADRFMWRAAASPLFTAVAEKTGSQAVEAQVVYLLDDPKFGYRRRSPSVRSSWSKKPKTGRFSDCRVIQGREASSWISTFTPAPKNRTSPRRMCLCKRTT